MTHSIRLRYVAIWIAASLIATACNLPRQVPSDAGTVIVRTPEATATQTPSSGMGTAAGYAIDFTQLSSSGLATMTAHAHSCSTLAGPWEGQVDLEFSVQDLHFAGSGPWSFTLSERRAEGEVMFSGSGGASECVLAQVSDALRFEIELNESGTAARIQMGSVGEGTMTIACPEAPPVTIPFAAAWGNEEFEVPVVPYTACR